MKIIVGHRRIFDSLAINVTHLRLKTDRKQKVIKFISNQTVLQIDTNTKISKVWTGIINKNRKYCENKQKGQSFCHF